MDCRFEKRLATIWLIALSTMPVEMRSPARCRSP
jgi:hypothetical protein